jgi:hypothetical protein
VRRIQLVGLSLRVRGRVYSFLVCRRQTTAAANVLSRGHRALRQAGWIINDKRVERIWQREGLKVPHKQPKRGRLWLADGSCIRLRPEQRNHVWSHDFVEDCLRRVAGCATPTAPPATLAQRPTLTNIPPGPLSGGRSIRTLR